MKHPVTDRPTAHRPVLPTIKGDPATKESKIRKQRHGLWQFGQRQFGDGWRYCPRLDETGKSAMAQRKGRNVKGHQKRNSAMKGSWHGPSWTSGNYGKTGKRFQTRLWSQNTSGKVFGKQKGLHEMSDWSQDVWDLQWNSCFSRHCPPVPLNYDCSMPARDSSHAMSLYIDMKMILSLKCSGSHSVIRLRIFSTRPNVVIPGNSFHSNSVGIPSIRFMSLK